jgi:CheY-like chemotaxis protein
VNILVIDENEHTRKGVARILERQGHLALPLSSSELRLAKQATLRHNNRLMSFEAWFRDLDLIICDADSSIVDQLAQGWLASGGPAAGFLLHTGDPNGIWRARKLGVQLLEKPTPACLLQQAVHNAALQLRN